MIATCPDRHRLEEMVQFAAAYRGWNTRQLADALQRDPRSLVPEKGVPKVDLVIRLADALDWPVGDLIEHLAAPASRRDASTGDAPAVPVTRFGFHDDVERLADLRTFVADGDLDAAIELAEVLSVDAADDALRRDAALLLADAAERRGRPMVALAALQRAARIETGDEASRLIALGRLADAYHRTGQPTEAAAIAAEAIAVADRDRPATRRRTETAAMAVAHARAVRAACARDTVIERGLGAADALAARGLLDEANAALDGLEGDEARGLALIVEAGRMAMDVCANVRPIVEVLDRTLHLLDEAIDPNQLADRHRLVGLGWWCVLTGAVALGRLEGGRMHRTLAILTNKADELAGAVDCWALRERILTIEHGRRLRVAEIAGHDEPWLLDREDLRIVIGCMGASRRFRPIGMRILRSAVLVDEQGR